MMMEAVKTNHRKWTKASIRRKISLRRTQSVIEWVQNVCRHPHSNMPSGRERVMPKP